MNTEFLNFEIYLGKNIDEFMKLKNLQIQNEEFFNRQSSGFSFPQFKMNTQFLGLHPVSISVSIDEMKIIQSIDVNFKERIDILFFEKLITKYEAPNNILKENKLESESKTDINEDEGFNQQLTKRFYSMEEVEFKDQPTLILWNKTNYKIEIRFDDKLSFTQISFRNNNQIL